MAARTSLRDYQRELAERIKSAAAGRPASKLGVQVGADAWLVDLTDAGEVIPVPPLMPVPLTRPWFRGVANIRGRLCSIVDFPAFLDGPATTLGEQARLLLFGDKFRISGGLLVDRSLGLRAANQLQADPTPGRVSPWQKGQFKDADGRSWRELDVARLVQSDAFLEVAA